MASVSASFLMKPLLEARDLVIVAAVRLEAACVLQHLRLLFDKALLLHLVLEVTVVEGVEA